MKERQTPSQYIKRKEMKKRKNVKSERLSPSSAPAAHESEVKLPHSRAKDTRQEHAQDSEPRDCADRCAAAAAAGSCRGGGLGRTVGSGGRGRGPQSGAAAGGGYRLTEGVPAWARGNSCACGGSVSR